MSTDALALAHKAEALIAEGDLDEGMPMLLEALDLEPTLFVAIEHLGFVVNEEPDAWREELFNRLRGAVERAPDSDTLRRASWLQMAYAAFHDRVDLVKSVMRAPDPFLDGRALQASVGALLVELGEKERGVLLVEGAAGSMAEYHRARLDWLSGNSNSAMQRLESLPTRGMDGILRDCGLLLISLESTPMDSIVLGAAKSLASKAESWEDPLGPHLTSEVLWLELKTALVGNKTHDAHWAAERLGMPPGHHDPGVMLRARALLGPLHLLKG